MEAKDVRELGGEGKLLVSEEATASGAVTIAPTDMSGNAVTLSNHTEQVCHARRGICVQAGSRTRTCLQGQLFRTEAGRTRPFTATRL